MEKKNNTEKKKRYYRINEDVWIKPLNRVGKVMKINKEEKEMTVTYDNNNGVIEKYKAKFWEFDKLKYEAKKQVEKMKKAKENLKINYFAPVKNGVIPIRNIENAGRDCFARLEPVERNGKKVYEMYLPKMQLSKIPLGFASYLQKDDCLIISLERSSVGELGILIMSGLIDSTYQGEVKLQVIPLLHNVLITSEVEKIEYDKETNTILFPYKKAIAQAVVLKQSDAKDMHISYKDLLKKPSVRGTKGWGSTDK